MLNLVEVRTDQGDLLGLPLEDISGGYIIADIEGLGPVKATIVSSSFANMDGVQYHSARREARNLVIKLQLEPDFVTTTVKGLRDRLYNFFMSKRNVNLRFYDSEGLIVNISGVVESCEPTIFAEEPAVDISIICFKPDFIDMESVEIEGMSTAGSTETLIEYTGTVETGIEFIFNIDRTLAEFTFYHNPPDGTLRSLDFSFPLIAGDILTIKTIPSEKELILTREGTNSSVLSGMSPQSDWIKLIPGNNNIRVYAEGDPIPFSLKYTNRYGAL